MANNRELSQFGSYIVVNDSSIIGINTDLAVTGIVTGRTLSAGGKITLNSSGIVTATSGVVTYYGDGQHLINTGVRGIATSGGTVGTGVTFIHFLGSGISTATVNSGIATIYFENNATKIGVGTTPGEAGFPVGLVTSGNLWYNSNEGRLFIFYDDGSSTQWVDASPFNVGILTSLSFVSFDSGSLESPSWYFSDDVQTGAFSPQNGQISFISIGSSILNINPAGIRVTGNALISSGMVVTGVTTSTDFNSSSDVSLKKDIATISNGLDIVEKLRGVNFTWVADDRPSAGVIAQEVEEVLPQIVVGDDCKSVNYNGLIAVLIEAVKELSTELKQLKDQLNK
jgi:hypothetical protein